MDATYRYRTSGRSPIMGVALVASLAAMAFGWSVGAHWIILTPMAIAALSSAMSMALNRSYGIDLDDHTLTIIEHKTVKPVPLADISEVVIKDWSDSTEVNLHMKDGVTVSIPGTAIPPSNLLEKELKNRRIPVVRT